MTGIPFDPDAPGTGDGIFGLPHTAEEADVVLLAIPWEATVSYGSGAHHGPEAIRTASQQVDLFDLENGRFYERGIHLLPSPPEVESQSEEARRLVKKILRDTDGAGLPESEPGTKLAERLARVNELGSWLNEYVARECDAWRVKGKLVGLVGGDHSSPFGAMESAARAHGEFGVLQIDAHADLRPAFMGFEWSHASIFHNVLARIPEVTKLVQVGIRDLGNNEVAQIEGAPDRIRTYFDLEIQSRLADGVTWSDIRKAIVDTLPEQVYVSFDIDGLDPSLCPNTGTPVPGGLSFFQASSLIAEVTNSGRRIIGFDLCEVAPSPEGDSEWDANVGARILYKMIGHALRNR
ncbi:MAG: agmatinase family protein [Candidatus Eisenbacteria bacterium]